MIFAGLGKPTYPINSHTIASYLSYWKKLDDLTKNGTKNHVRSKRIWLLIMGILGETTLPEG